MQRMHQDTLGRLAASALLCVAIAWPGLARAAASGLGKNPEQVRSILYNHSLRDLDGKALSVASLRGQVVVLNVWASWCPPCRRELPDLDAFHTEISKQGGRVVAISIDLEQDNVRRYVRKLGLSLPVYLDRPDGLARELDLQALPFTIVLDRAGEVAYASGGADEASLERMKTLTRRLLTAEPYGFDSTRGGTP